MEKSIKGTTEENIRPFLRLILAENKNFKSLHFTWDFLSVWFHLEFLEAFEKTEVNSWEDICRIFFSIFYLFGHTSE